MEELSVGILDMMVYELCFRVLDLKTLGCLGFGCRQNCYLNIELGIFLQGA